MRTVKQASAAAPERRGPARAIPLSVVWVVAVVAVPVALRAAAPLVTVDLTYLVRAGDEMLDGGGILRTDVMLAWTLGRPWLNQQWGAEIVLAAIYRVGGWLGLALLRALLQTAVLALVYLACRASGATRRAAAFLTFGGAVVGYGGLLLRAQLFGLACFAATLWLVAGRARHPRRLWWVIPIEVLWVNVHGSFFLGPLLLALAFFDDRSRRAPTASRTLQVGAATLLATFITPFGARAWSYVLDVSTDPRVVETVREWRPPSVRTLTGALFFASVVAVAGFLARRSRPTPWPALLTLGVFLLLALPVARGTLWWTLAAPVTVAGLLEAPRHRSADPVSALNVGLVGLLVVVALVPFVRWLPYSGPEPPSHLLSYGPVRLTDELRDVLAPGETFFNPQEWGSWFELELPDNPVIADSRFELIPTARWEEYVAISAGREDWPEILDRWGIRVAVLSRDQQDDLIPIIRDDPGWSLVYEDYDGLVFARS